MTDDHTPEHLVAQAERWRALVGRWPVSTDWAVAYTRSSEERKAAARHWDRLTGPWPSESLVGLVFGSWGAFMRAVGAEPVRTCLGVKHGQRAAEIRAAIDRLKDPHYDEREDATL